MNSNKLTIERISDLIAQYESDGFNDATDSEVISVIAELQEYRKAAEPVAFRLKLKRACGAGNWRYIDHRQPDAFELENCDIEYLLSTTPAPAVEAVPVVPDGINDIIERFQHQADHLSDWHHIDEHSCKVNRRDLITALDFMNACRAAMPQPVSNRDELTVHSVSGYCRNHPDTQLINHPDMHTASIPPQPVKYCPKCDSPGVSGRRGDEK
ncbi:hypothetical protein ACQVA2_07925 [Citrobacter sp. OP27]